MSAAVIPKQLDCSADRMSTTSNTSVEQSPGHDDSVHSLPDVPHWVQVAPLRTASTDELLKVFFPYGADEVVLSEADGCAFVGFQHGEAATLAAEKMNNSVPLQFNYALQVTVVAKDVVVARERKELFKAASPGSPSNAAAAGAPKNTLRSLLGLKTSTPMHVAHYIQQQADPQQSAAEVSDIVRGGVCPAKLKKLTDGLACIMDLWSGSASLRNETVRALLGLIFGGDDAVAMSSSRLIGLLFVNKFITGDPFELAAKLLGSDSETIDSARVNVVLNLVEECGGMVFPVSSAGFWARIADVANRTDDFSLRSTCQRHLASNFKSPTKSSSPPFTASAQGTASSVARQLQFGFSPVEPQPSSASTKRRMDELRRRTVYVSRIDPLLSQGKLRSVLEQFGTVKKVRVCRRTGFTTLYGFVEMAMSESVSAMCDAGGWKGMRLQPAKSPIQDVHQSDAVEGPFVEGPSQYCTFGIDRSQHDPLKDCAVAQ